LEAAVDCVVDLKLEEAGDETSNLIRVRNMRSVGFDSRWHRLKIGGNLEITLEK
jgi:KaiC/GvpD/RAD55 family RecA-like ATPase